MLSRYLIFCFLFIGVWANEEYVQELTDDDFQTRLKSFENSLVMFYAPWCGHCKHLKPEFAKAAETITKNDLPITLAKVDCTGAGKKTCESFSVSGYPTLKTFSGGEFVAEYNGPREADGIVKYMRNQVGPASQELKSEESKKSFLNTDEISCIGYFEKDDSPLSAVYHTIAKKLRETVRFAHIVAKELLEAEGYKNHIVLYRPKALSNIFEPDFLVYEGSDKITDLNDFINKNYFGLAGIRTRDNAKKFENPLVVAYYNVDYAKNPKGSNYWRNRIMKVAQKFKDVINFAVSSKDHFQHELNDFGVDFVKGEKPVILGRDKNNRKFVLQGEFSLESFEKFLKDFVAGKLEPFLKSEPVPEDNSGNVKVCVAKNFDELVTNNDKDVLIEFYAPWCGHCKKLTPIYDELGDKMKDEDVEIVKFDATANDVPSQFEVHGFPTLYWVPKNSKSKPVKYESGRELEQFIKFIAKNAMNELKGYDRDGKSKKPLSDEL